MTNPNGNPVLSTVQLVTLTLKDYPYQSQVEALGSFLQSTNWLAGPLAEYGAAQTLTNQNVHLNEPAPASLDDTQLQTWLQREIAAGTLPAPSANFTPLYALYYPASTTVTNELGAASCSAFSGYHLEAAYNAVVSSYTFYYAVISDCGPGLGTTALQEIESTATHEIAEAATDPRDIELTHDAFIDRDYESPWVLTNFLTEVGDLCEGQTVAASAGDVSFTLQQVWSDRAAAAGAAPCQPVDPGRPYYAVAADAPTKRAAAGSSVQFTLTGWSSGPTAPWTVVASPWMGPSNSFAPAVSLSTSALNNRQTATLTVGIPASAAAGAYAGVYLVSELGDGTYSEVPILIYAQ